MLAPRREKRPDQHHAHGKKVICPFDPGNEGMTEEIAKYGEKESGLWQVRVVKNIFPITPIHEVIIHSPKHDSSLTVLPLDHVQQIFRVFQDRYNALQARGYPLIFHNHGGGAGESLRHGHSQLAVVPSHVGLNSPLAQKPHNIALKSKSLVAFCPDFSEWSYETWIQPFPRGRNFGQADADQVNELAKMTQRILTSLLAAHEDLAYNFYIYPADDWYLRIVGRSSVRAGFELGSGIPVNIVDPKDVVKILS